MVRGSGHILFQGRSGAPQVDIGFADRSVPVEPVQSIRGTVEGQIISVLSIYASSKSAIGAAKLLSLRFIPALLTGGL